MGSAEVEHALRAVDELPPGPTQVLAAERSVTIADELGTLTQQIQARINLIAVYETSRPGEHELPHLSWLLNQLSDPNEPDALTKRQRFEILWECRFALARTRRSARIPLKIVRRMYADIEQRYRSEGVSPNLYAKHRTLLARDTDGDEVAQRWMRAWVESPRDELSDCASCDQAEQARAMADDGNLERALGHVADLLDGRRQCGEEPARLFGAAADWSMRLGLIEQAEDYHRRGWPLVAEQGRFTAAAADHLMYLAKAGRSARAVRLALRVLPYVTDELDDYDRLHAGAIVGRVLKFGRGYAMLPREIEGQSAGEVIADLDQHARELIRRFDQRNGTTRVSERVSSAMRLAPYDIEASPAARRLDGLERVLLGAPTATVRASRVARPTSILGYADELYFASDALDAAMVTSLIEHWMQDRSALLPARIPVEHQAVAYLDRRALASRAARQDPDVAEQLLASIAVAAELSEHEPTVSRTRIELLHRSALEGDASAWAPALGEVDQLAAAGELSEAAGALMALSRHPDPAQGVALARRAAELFEADGRPHWQATALQAAGYAAAFVDPHQSAQLLDRAFEMASAVDRPQLAVAVCATQAKAAWLRGDYSVARKLYAEAIAGADHFGTSDPLALRGEYAELLASDGQWTLVGDLAAQMTDIAHELGQPEDLAPAYRMLGLARFHAEDPSGAVEALEPALIALADRGDGLAASAHWTLGSAWLKLDRPDLAVAPLGEAARLFGQQGMSAEASAAHEATGRSAAAAARFEQAAAHLATAARLQRREGHREQMIDTLTGLARAFAAEDRTEDALATLATAMGEARGLDDMSIPQEEQLLGRLELQAAEVLAAAGRADEATEMFAAADHRLTHHGEPSDLAALARLRSWLPPIR